MYDVDIDIRFEFKRGNIKQHITEHDASAHIRRKNSSEPVWLSWMSMGF